MYVRRTYIQIHLLIIFNTENNVVSCDQWRSTKRNFNGQVSGEKCAGARQGLRQLGRGAGASQGCGARQRCGGQVVVRGIGKGAGERQRCGGQVGVWVLGKGAGARQGCGGQVGLWGLGRGVGARSRQVKGWWLGMRLNLDQARLVYGVWIRWGGGEVGLVSSWSWQNEQGKEWGWLLGILFTR